MHHPKSFQQPYFSRCCYICFAIEGTVGYLEILPLVNGGLWGDQSLFFKSPKYLVSQFPLSLNILKGSRSLTP